MALTTRAEFIEAQASEKITLAQVEATQRLLVWQGLGPIYTIVAPRYVVGIAQQNFVYTQNAAPSLSPGQWHYDPLTGVVSIRMVGDLDPNDSEIIATLRFFFSDAAVSAPYDLSDTGTFVDYEGRIKSAPGYKHKVGIDQKLISVTSSGTLALENNDGGLDEFYDSVFFENKEVRIYSWHRNLPYSQARIIYRGRVTDKSFTSDSVSFTVKDNLFDLQQNVPQGIFSDSDNVSDSIKGRYKRWIYGRVDGLRLQSTDQIKEGFQIDGTVSATVASEILTGVGTLFLSQTTPGDRITIGTQEFNIESVESDTELTLNSKPEFTFVGQTAIIEPEIPVVTKNRTFLVAGHACARLTKTLVERVQLNRLRLSDTDGLEPGDFITLSTGQRIEVKNTAPGNIVVLRQNYITPPPIGSSVVREPIQEIYIDGERVVSDNFTINNTTNATEVVLSATTEFDIANIETLGDTLTFVTGSRTVVGSGSVDLREIVSPRDFVRSTDVLFTTFYEVLDVEESQIILRVPVAEPTTTDPAEIKRPRYISDDTLVSANVLGRTVDGTPDGKWIKTAAEAALDLLNAINVPEINTATFASGAQSNVETISLAIPSTPSGSAETVKSAIDKLCRSTNSAITLDNDLRLKFQILLPEIAENAVEINDRDVIEWKLRSVNGDTIRNTLIRYRHQDIVRSTQEEGSLAVTYSSDFVRDYIGTNKGDELDVYLYDTKAATIMSHRLAYLRSLARTDVTMTTDLRFENIEIGDAVVLNFNRLYKRLGDKTTRKKVCVVVGKTVTGQRITWELTDLGNAFNRSSIITPNNAPDFTSSSADQKIKFGYITTNNGVINNEPDTGNINLIT